VQNHRIVTLLVKDLKFGYIMEQPLHKSVFAWRRFNGKVVRRDGGCQAAAHKSKLPHLVIC
jgi:hypothetical protein